MGWWSTNCQLSQKDKDLNDGVVYNFLNALPSFRQTTLLITKMSCYVMGFTIALRTDIVKVIPEYYLSEFIIYSCLFWHFQQKKIVH